MKTRLLAGHPALDELLLGDIVEEVYLNAFERYSHRQAEVPFHDWLDSLIDPSLKGLLRNPEEGRENASLARTLRETIRSLVERRKAGQRGDPSVLNAFLAEAQSHPRLVWNKQRSPTIDRVRRSETPVGILAPVAEAAADLLVTGDFKLVKRCEDEICELWFFDQTKSHHRRWCSTALCGNRHKVAAYRKRRRAENQ